MKNVSILGCGWLGKTLGISLIEKNFLVKGSSTKEDKIATLKSVKILPFLVDISTKKITKEFLNSEILIITITSKNSDDFLRLITQIEKSPVQKVIFISSTSVYPRSNKICSEKDEIAETPLSKIEHLFRKSTNFKTTIIRFAGLFGGERHPGNWFKNDKKIPQPNGFVNMIHREDCIGIIEQIIHQSIWNETFNVCSNHHPTRKEFYENAKKSKGLNLPIFEENKVLAWKIINSEKVQKKLNYNFIHDDLLNI